MLKIDGHDNAIIGPAMIWRDHTTVDVLVYNAEVIRDNLVKEGMDREDAREYIEFNIEGYPSPDFLQLVRETRPHQCTLVPDADNQLTSDHGWNIAGNHGLLKDVIARLHGGSLRLPRWSPTLGLGVLSKTSSPRFWNLVRSLANF